MQKSLFSVYDVKSTIFSSPFISVNAATAIRAFAHAVNDPSTEIFQYPADYILYEVGSFDDTSGVVSPLSERIYLGTASQFKEIQIKEVNTNVDNS